MLFCYCSVTELLEVAAGVVSRCFSGSFRWKRVGIRFSGDFFDGRVPGFFFLSWVLELMVGAHVLFCRVSIGLAELL